MPSIHRSKPLALSPLIYWLGRYWPDVLIGTLGGITLIAWLVIV